MSPAYYGNRWRDGFSTLLESIYPLSLTPNKGQLYSSEKNLFKKKKKKDYHYFFNSQAAVELIDLIVITAQYDGKSPFAPPFFFFLIFKSLDMVTLGHFADFHLLIRLP